MKISRETSLTATLWAFAPLFLGLAIAGGVRAYSPVPYGDMWDGYLDFYLKVRDGQWSQWWAQHNEHRILLAKLLFWIDLSWLQGRVWFLIIVNYLLVGCAFLLYRAILKERAPSWAGSNAVTQISLLIFILLFSWIQRENLAWGFQSQFFLAHLLPLLALYQLHRATLPGGRSNARFALACVVGVMCYGTMANGVLALPLMCLYAAVMRMGWRRTAILALLAALCLAAYFFDYQSPGGNLLRAARTQPVRLLKFILLFLGSPFFHFLGHKSLAVGHVFGLIFVVLSIRKAIECLRAPQQHSLEIALLAFVAFIIGSAIAVGSGRLLLVWGMSQAYASRYNTPMLMGWIALLMLYLPAILKSLHAMQHRVVLPMLALLACMLPLQLKALESQQDFLFDLNVTALGLELGINDERQASQTVWTGVPHVLRIVEKASREHVSVFGAPPIRDARLSLREPLGATPSAPCAGGITEVADLESGQDFVRFLGWLAPAQDGSRITAVKLADSRGIVVGYALADDARAGPVPQGTSDTRIGNRTQRFKGYLLSSAQRGALTFVSIEGNCTFSTDSPAFRVIAGPPAAEPIAVNARDIMTSTGWSGTDSHRSHIAGMRVLGSYTQGDADVGTVTLRLKRGASLAYRSGPVIAQQRFAIDDGKRFSGTLPFSDQWSTLVFDNTDLPDEFTLTLTDNGAGWGEWSAIAIHDKP
jgi:hypothetical protein